jgi:beta-aspartyl-peptidase (threonine type)
MKHHRKILVLLAIGGIISNITAAEDDSAGEIRAVIQSQQEAWNRGDLESFMNGYWRSDKTAFVTGGDVARGWQTVLDHYKAKYSDREKMGTLTFSDLEITPLAPDSALVLGSWKLQLKNGNLHGKTTLIFRRVPEGWRIVHDHSSAAQ